MRPWEVRRLVKLVIYLHREAGLTNFRKLVLSKVPILPFPTITNIPVLWNCGFHFALVRRKQRLVGSIYYLENQILGAKSNGTGQQTVHGISPLWLFLTLCLYFFWSCNINWAKVLTRHLVRYEKEINIAKSWFNSQSNIICYESYFNI